MTQDNRGRTYAEREETNGYMRQRAISVKIDGNVWRLLDAYYAKRVFPSRNRLINEALEVYLKRILSNVDK